MRLTVSVGLLWTWCLAGCFYIDPIIHRPHVVITRDGAPVESEVRRAADVTLRATFQPSGHEGSYSWNAYACDTLPPGGSAAGCDDQPFFIGRSGQATFTVGVKTRAGNLVKAVRVRLDARDDRGALAPASIPDLPVADAAPTLELNHTALSYTVGASVDVFATYGDPDDGPDRVTLSWSVVTPVTDPSVPLGDLALVAPNTDHLTAGRRLVPTVPGMWNIEVTARDPVGTKTTMQTTFSVAPDEAPCIAQSSPIVPPEGRVLPITEPTVFEVPLVHDDLDSYPPASGDPEFGTTAFAWSILPPRASQRQPLASATGNAVELDPAGFTPGDIVELRVEVFDRSHPAVACPDDQPTCAAALPACIQRQTWHVEVR